MTQPDPPDTGTAPVIDELPAWLRTVAPPGRAGSRRALRARGQDMANRLLEAGRDAFWVHGYDAARVDDIVELAGASHGTFYLYFRNKEDLLHQLAIGCAADVRVLTEQLDTIELPPTVEGLASWVDGFVEAYRRHGPVLRIWLERRDLDPLMASLASDVLGGLSTALGRLVDPAVDSAIGPGLVRLSLLTMLERFTSYHQISGGVLPKEPLVATQARLFAAIMNPGGLTAAGRASGRR